MKIFGKMRNTVKQDIIICMSDRLIKQRNNLHCSTTAYIQGIPSTPRQHGNRLNSAGNDLGLRLSFHDHIISDH